MGIRKYQHRDYSQIQDIYDVSRPDEFYAEREQFSLVLWAEDDYIQSIFKDSEIYVYEQDNILGFCGYVGKHINWLFVAPEFRDEGVASRLLASVMPLIGTGATLTVGQSNVRAFKLYTKLGFTVQRNFVVEFQSKQLAVRTLVWIE